MTLSARRDAVKTPGAASDSGDPRQARLQTWDLIVLFCRTAGSAWYASRTVTIKLTNVLSSAPWVGLAHGCIPGLPPLAVTKTVANVFMKKPVVHCI
jgi:hypothetical protein